MGRRFGGLGGFKLQGMGSRAMPEPKRLEWDFCVVHHRVHVTLNSRWGMMNVNNKCSHSVCTILE